MRCYLLDQVEAVELELPYRCLHEADFKRGAQVDLRRGNGSTRQQADASAELDQHKLEARRAFKACSMLQSSKSLYLFISTDSVPSARFSTL